MKIINTLTVVGLATLVLVGTAAKPSFAQMDMDMDMDKPMTLGTTGMFKGVEAKTGSVELYRVGSEFHLRVSKDFKIPQTPAPSWQVVDGRGNAFLFNQFKIAGGKTNQDIKLPAYVTSISKVRVYCTFAEVVLGEASFAKTIVLK